MHPKENQFIIKNQHKNLVFNVLYGVLDTDRSPKKAFENTYASEVPLLPARSVGYCCETTNRLLTVPIRASALKPHLLDAEL